MVFIPVEKRSNTNLKIGVRTVNFRLGGVYTQNLANPNQVINQGHSTYGGLPTKKGYERNDIFPVSLGGVNTNPANIEYQPTGFNFKIPFINKKISIGNEADYRDNVEKYLAKQYKDGKIDLMTARSRVFNWKNVDIPGQVAWDRKLGGKQTTLGNILPSLGEYFKGTVSKVKNIASDILNLKPMQESMKNINPLLVPIVGPYMQMAQGGKAVIDTIKGAVEQDKQNIQNYWKIAKTNAPVSQKVAAGMKVVTGQLGVVFSPISAVFAGAEQAPILGTVSKLITLPFDVSGDIGGETAKGILNVLPISQADKNNLNEAVEEIGTLTGQIILGGKIFQVLMKAKPRLTEKYGEQGANDIIDATRKKVEATKIPVEFEPSEAINIPVKVKKFIPVAERGAEIAPEAIKEAIPAEKGISVKEELKGKTPLEIARQAKANYAKSGEALAQEIGYKPETPSERGTGKYKTPQLSLGVEEKAISEHLTKSLGDLPQYKTTDWDTQAKNALDLVKKDPDLSLKVARGEEPPPSGILATAIFKAVEDNALAKGDIVTLRELATGELTQRASGMGQEIGYLSERSPESPVKAMQDVIKSRKERVETKYGKKATEKVTDQIKKEIEKTTPNIKEWQDLLNRIACKT